jgi:hypothetical protein
VDESAAWPHHTGEPGNDADRRAPTLLSTVNVALHDLPLDPGDELTISDDPALAAEAAFMRAFVPVRSYRRLQESDLDGLASSIALNPARLAGRILVRALPDVNGQFVVIDGSRHVAALRHLAETGSANGVGLSNDVIALFSSCPVTIVHPETDPAFVLALISDGSEHDADPWLHGQRNHQLHLLAREGVHHSLPTLNSAADGDTQIIRRYHAYRALGQMMQEEDVPVHVAAELYPLFHAAVGRSVIRTWLDWDDTMCCFMDDAQLERFYDLLQPSVRADGITRPPCIATVNAVVQLCDVLSEPAARATLLEQHRTLDEAVDVINAGAFHEWTATVSDAYETIRWNQRRFGPQH